MKSYEDLDDRDENGNGCLQHVLAVVLLAASALLLASGSVKPEYFAWLDWDANPPSDNVLYYTLYIGDQTNPQAKIELGNQTSIQVIRNHQHIYAAVTATNAIGESPRSNEVHITSP